ncbi:MAG: site-specific integrase [Spirochaetes bacterium]|nr:MAG: site-specific integrase [Spirochaetota bacterium]
MSPVRPVTTSAGEKRWEAYWREGGRQRSKRFDRKRDADAHVAQRRLDRARGVRPADDRITLNQLVSDYITAAAPRISKRYLETLQIQTTKATAYIGGYRAIEVDEEIADRMLDALARVHGAATVNRVRSVMHTIYADAIRRRALHHNPFAATAKRAAPKPLAQPLAVDELHAVADAAGERLHRDYAAIIVGGYTGLRLGELFALQRSDVRDGMIIVRHALDLDRSLKAPKTGGWREVQLLEPAAAALEEWLAVAPEHELVFPGMRGAVMHVGNWRRRSWAPAAALAAERLDRPELAARRPGELRHTAASIAFAHGASVLWVQQQLGHADASMTLRVYSHLIRRYDTRERERLNRSLAGAHDSTTPAPASARPVTMRHDYLAALTISSEKTTRDNLQRTTGVHHAAW